MPKNQTTMTLPQQRVVVLLTSPYNKQRQQQWHLSRGIALKGLILVNVRHWWVSEVSSSFSPFISPRLCRTWLPMWHPQKSSSSIGTQTAPLGGRKATAAFAGTSFYKYQWRRVTSSAATIARAEWNCWLTIEWGASGIGNCERGLGK